jgi:hypothetical protein
MGRSQPTIHVDNRKKGETIMREFNLEDAKAGKPVCTRDGKDVKILDFDFYTPNYQDYTKPNHFLVVKIKKQTDDEIIDLYELNGLKNQDGTESQDDLLMKPEKHEGWGWLGKSSCVYTTKEDALDNAREGAFLAKVEWEE